MDVWVKTIGEKRGKPHIYFDGNQIVRAGFSPGDKFDLVVDGKRVILSANNDGSRTISSRRAGEKTYPIIDINSKELVDLFEGMSSIRVVIAKGKVILLPLASEIKKRERLERITKKINEGQTLQMASLSHGGGILSHAIHEGLKRAGIDAQLAFANEIREDLLLQAIENNDAWDDKTMALAMPMQEVAQDEWLLSRLPEIDCLEMGLPCSGASRAGASKRGLEKMEDHPEVGHLVHSALVILNKTQPAFVLLENVPEYAKSASASILRYQLRDMGYETHEAILEGKDFGCMENRTRWCLVGVTKGIDFDMDNLAPTVRVVRKLKEFLDSSILPDDPRYREVGYLKEKMLRDAEKGNSFAMQTITGESTSVPTLRKGYAKGGSTDPRLLNPENPERSRLLTAAEHARVKGVPDHLIDDLSETLAHQLLGQGIVYAPFESVGHRIGEALLALVDVDKKIAENTEDQVEPVRRKRSFGVG